MNSHILTGPKNMSAAALVPDSDGTASSMTSKTDARSPVGALYYVIAVVMIYGMSILLMIGSQIRKNKYDKGVSRYMKDIEKVRRMERRQEKFKMRLAMQQKHPVLGQTRSARAQERAKLDQVGLGKHRRQRQGHFTGCYGSVPDDAAITFPDLDSAATSGSGTQFPTAAQTSLVQHTHHDAERPLTTLGADQYSDAFTTDAVDLTAADITDDRHGHKNTPVDDDGNEDDDEAEEDQGELGKQKEELRSAHGVHLWETNLENSNACRQFPDEDYEADDLLVSRTFTADDPTMQRRNSEQECDICEATELQFINRGKSTTRPC